MPRGFVVGVISGDTLAVKMIEQPGSPIGAISLECVQSPKIGSIDGRIQDEPNGWPAYDFTRKLTIGKRIIYSPIKGHVDLKRHHPNYGLLPVTIARVSLFDSGNKDLGLALVESGFAKVRNQQKEEDDYVSNLKFAEQSAKDSKIGIWAEQGFVRSLPKEYVPQKLIAQKEFEGMVSSVINGSTFNVWLFPNLEYITLQLAGIRTPSAKRGAPELFGPEAKAFSEARLLERTVKITLYQYNKEMGNFIGRILHPNGDISVFLVSDGLAQMNNQTSVLIPNSEEIRKAELRAKESKKNLWKNFDTKTLRTTRVDGRVVSIKGSSSIEVNDGNTIRRIWLSCCRVPQFNPSSTSEPYGLEARELLRHTLIGKDVQCVIDYTVEERPYATVYIGNDCINEVLIEHGYASCLTSKNNKPSDRIDGMLRAEQTAKSKKLGIHSGSKPNSQINDLSNKHSKQRSIPFLHYVERKNNHGVIEYFVTPTRVVVLIPEQHCIIRVNLQGLVAPDTQERIGSEALEYCNNTFLQRDIELHVQSVDKVGCFIGNINIVEGNNTYSLESKLLEKGYTEIHKPSISKCMNRREMEAAEEKAKANKVGIWSLKLNEVKLLEPNKVYSVIVIDILDPITIIIQVQSNELKIINEGLKQAKITLGKVMRGDLVAAIYENKLYRGKVLEVKGDEIEIEFLELAINDEVNIKDLRVLPDSISKIPPQAMPVRLAGLKPFRIDEDYNNSAMEFIWSKVEDAQLYAHLMYDDGMPNILLTDQSNINSGSMNAVLLDEGIVRSYAVEDLDEQFKGIMDEFENIENEARNNKKGAWIHGNIADSDDDDDAYY